MRAGAVIAWRAPGRRVVAIVWFEWIAKVERIAPE